MSIYVSSDLVLADISGDFRPDAPLVGYRTLITITNITATEEADGFPVTNLANPATDELWKGETTSAQVIRVALGAPQLCDYVGIARHNLGSTGCTVQVQSSADGVSWTDVGDDFIPGDDSSIMVRFEDTTAAFFRLELTPGSAAPEIAVLYLGKLLILQRNIYVGYSPMTYDYTNVSSVGISESGEFLGGIARRANPSTAVQQKNLTPTWFRTYMHPFFRQCVGNGTDRKRTPFFFAWKPTTYPVEVAFGWFPEGTPPNVQNSRANGMMDAGFSMTGIL